MEEKVLIYVDGKSIHKDREGKPRELLYTRRSYEQYELRMLKTLWAFLRLSQKNHFLSVYKRGRLKGKQLLSPIYY